MKEDSITERKIPKLEFCYQELQSVCVLFAKSRCFKLEEKHLQLDAISLMSKIRKKHFV